MFPIRDRIAIVGLGRSGYVRNSDDSVRTLAARACIEAVRDAKLTRAEIDGICGVPAVPTEEIQEALGIPELTWWSNAIAPFQRHVIEAMNAVHAGTCRAVLCYNAVYRNTGTSKSAAADPFRERHVFTDPHVIREQNVFAGPIGYAGWAARYLHDFGVDRTAFGLIAVNGRTNALANDHAVARTPLTLESYYKAPIIRWPLSRLDMDYPVDAADAFVLTTTERARTLVENPVVIHAASLGRTSALWDRVPDFSLTGQHIAANALWSRSDLQLSDFDLFYPYDGFTVIAARWFEVIGFCADGEAGDFLRSQWDDTENRLNVHGHVRVNPHGGSLSEGATQGAGHLSDAVRQLRGDAGDRQVQGVQTALLTPGGWLSNAGTIALRVDR